MRFEKRISVLVADDHPVFRQGLVSLLSLLPGMEVIGEAANGRIAVEQAKIHEPDVVLMDIGMPELNGLEATRLIKKYAPSCKVLVISGHDNDEYVREIVESGANGFVLKNTPVEELQQAIIAVSRGQEFFSPSVSEAVVGSRLTSGISRLSADDRRKKKLTPREREILQLVAEGKRHSRIAQLLHISIRTVDTHRNNILKKLGLHDAASLVTYAIKNGIIILPK